jgi:hypothetical protein
MRVGSADEIKFDVGIFQSCAQIIDRAPYLRAVIMIEARKNVRGACNELDPLSGKNPRHLDRGCKVGCSIVDAGQDVALEIQHLT